MRQTLNETSCQEQPAKHPLTDVQVLPNIRPIWRGEITVCQAHAFSDNPCKWNNSFKVVILPREEIQNPPVCPRQADKVGRMSSRLW